MIQVILPKDYKLSQVHWVYHNDGLFPKFNFKNIPGMNRSLVKGCSLYWKLRNNLYNDIKTNNTDVKWVKAEYPYYYESLNVINKGNNQYKQMTAFADMIIVYKKYMISIEVDEDKPHSNTSAQYYNNNLSKWLNRQMADKGKDKELYNNGVISMHVSESETYDDVLKEIKLLFKKIDKLCCV
jgi:hypothetical protein